MTPKRYSYQSELTIIDFFKEHRFFWDHTDANHKLAKKSAAADELVSLLNGEFSIDQLFDKFNSLRSTFRDNHRKATTRKSGSGTDELFVPKWWHYSRMMFLTDTYTPRNSMGTPISDFTHRAASEVSIILFDNEGNPLVNDSPDPNTTSHPESSPHHESQLLAEPSFSGGGQKRKKSASVDEDNLELMELARKAFSTTTEETEHTAWATHAAISLSKMSSFHAALAKMEMDKILLSFHPDNPSLN